MNIYRVTLVAVALAGAASMSTPVLADPPDWAPAHGYRAQQQAPHRYVYYREREVYYSPESRLWFWLDGSNWRFGASLPIGFQQYTTGGISIELNSDRPYTEHRYVVEHYGRGPSHHRYERDDRRDRNDRRYRHER